VDNEALEPRVRLHIYDRFVEDGRPPSVEETAEALGLRCEETEAAFRALEQAHVIVLAPGTTDVWMANPLSAVPTAFPVETERGAYFGNCIWDALGVVAMLGGSGRVSTRCPDCGEQLELSVRDRRLEPVDAVVHYAVSAARWWENIGYT
jgi:Alkylmercury lyase